MKDICLDKKITIASLVIVLIAVLATPRFLDLVTECGHYIPQPDLPTDYLKGLSWALVLLAGIFFFPLSPGNKKCLLAAWLAKICLTLGVMLFYESFYGLDSCMYFDESNRTTFELSRFTTVGTTAGTYNIINLASFNNIFIPNSYHAQKVSFAMIGLFGVFIFYRSAVLFLGREDKRIFYLLAFFPGIVFWSSTLGKEPIVLFAIALYVYGTVSWYVSRRYRSFLMIAAGVFLAVLIRVWLGPIMVLPLMIFFLKAPGNRLAKLLLIAVACVGLVFSAGPMLAKFKIQAVEDVLAAADKTTQGFVNTEGGSTQQLQVDLTSPAGAVKFLPVAAFTALFRPLPGEVMNPFGLMAGAESLLLLTLLIVAARRTTLKELSDPLIVWCISFIVIWALVNGIVSSTNFGVAVRYKLQVLPMLLGLLIYLARERKRGRITAEGTAAEILHKPCASATAAAAMAGESRTGG